MNDEMIEKQVKEIIRKIRPYIQRDGGDIRYVRFEDGIVFVEMLGACVGCGALDSTLKDGIETILLEEVPGIIGVENI
ncbi:NifU family protein [Candidatus Xianfuyuplasma coldseepsis]|uniref:NifU family protein n=1 Tax=Candidatus Xianfuyuplasma coldseepsis TaxID=2782163 RepID=A0A7L7KQP8_9MOLU|nr:NifU family protein [Xianfuyuplasma coldseepsis]QMS84905.1 NifU family protein [Xianfuyuplasma coldseepsis]